MTVKDPSHEPSTLRDSPGPWLGVPDRLREAWSVADGVGEREVVGDGEAVADPLLDHVVLCEPVAVPVGLSVRVGEVERVAVGAGRPWAGRVPYAGSRHMGGKGGHGPGIPTR